LEATTKQRLMKNAKTLCAVIAVIFGVCNPVRLSQIVIVMSAQ
jgi:hypothetical protein